MLCAALLFASAVQAATPSDQEIRTILTERLRDRPGIGIVVGIIDPHGRRVIAVGPGEPAFDGNTAFEIASVTKVFTGLLLAAMSARHEVALTDPVARFLPALHVPAHDGHVIRLVDLATHTSGLPFMAEPSPEIFIDGYQLRRDPGTQWEYSNLGYWLLGRALEEKSGVSYQTLLRTRILGPLRLNSTAVHPPPDLQKRLAPGYDASLQRAPSALDIPGYGTMAAAGGLVSTTNDLLTLLAAVSGLNHSSLDSAIALALRTRRPKNADVDQAIGWLIVDKNRQPIAFHDGGSFGYASAVALDLNKRIGVTVLMNQIGDVSDLALHLLNPQVPLAKPPAFETHTEIALSDAVLDSYAGKYVAEGEGTFIIAREGEALTIESPEDWGLPKLRLRPESSHDFFVRELPVRVRFQAGGMIIYPPRGQKGVAATRVR